MERELLQENNVYVMLTVHVIIIIIINMVCLSSKRLTDWTKDHMIYFSYNKKQFQ